VSYGLNKLRVVAREADAGVVWFKNEIESVLAADAASVIDEVCGKP
jgi:hypothetical protein